MKTNPEQRVIVIGAGPAGLSAAWELCRSGHEVLVLEQEPDHVGGLARTLTFRGCRFDLGAHRFFSQNADITRWWRERLTDDFIRLERKTRILYRGKYFDYPLRAGQALLRLGPFTSVGCVLSYFKRRVFPLRPERSFADWVRNRFGDRLFEIFFRTYTEKVWGMSCEAISADWASQRIRGLSLKEALINALRWKPATTVRTLIDAFDYPRQGAGKMWKQARDEILQSGGEILMGRTVTRLEREDGRIVAVECNGTETFPCDQVISSMPLKDAVLAVDPPLEPEVLNSARQLRYRDFLLVVLIIRKRDLFPDQWIYIHDPSVSVGRIENYNNWGDGMVENPDLTCLTLEYFCSKGDPLWERSDGELITLGKREVTTLGLLGPEDVMDATVVRVEKAYPVYDHQYQDHLKRILPALKKISNLQPVGRAGMHKYNNQDHSMLTGRLAARNLVRHEHDLWSINTDARYHEQGHHPVLERNVPQPLGPR